MAYLLGRVVSSLLVLVGVSVIVFMIIHLVPGDPVQVMYGTRISSERAAEIRSELGFDKPVAVQYLDWAGRLLRGDLGASVVSGRPILTDLLLRLPVTLELALLGSILALAVGLPLGILSAHRPAGQAGFWATAFSLTGIAIPNFLLATVLVYVFSVRLGWLPPLGYTPLSEDWRRNLSQMVLPAVSVSAVMLATMTRMTRVAMLEVLSADFSRTARAKGLSEMRILRQALRTVLATITTMGGIEIAKLLGGTLIIEKVFVLPGIGTYTIDAIFARDFPIVQATVLFSATVFVVANIVVDLLYRVLDPRVTL